MNNKPIILVYDIETLYLTGHFWRLGEQAIRHNQLSKHRNMTEIVCITYVFNDGKAPKALVFEYGKEDSMKNMIAEFDALVKSADMLIGKNSDRFDNKHINTARLMAGLPANPEWLEQTDDLEKQLRKYFNMPSQSLDFWSKKFNLGGKIKMEWDDWVAIEEGHTMAILHKKMRGYNLHVLNSIAGYLFKDTFLSVIHKGKKALNKMVKYGKKDVADTLALINKVMPHVTFKINHGKICNKPMACRRCGSRNIETTYQRFRGKTNYQYFKCLTHRGSAGKLPLNKDKLFKQDGILE